jgi:hypothetical protein
VTTLTEEFCLLLQAKGFGTYPTDPTDTTGTIFLHQLPATPDEAIAVTRYAGGEGESLQGYDQMQVQVRVRGARHDAADPEQTAQDIYDALHGLRSQPLPGGTWLVHLIGVNGGPAPMGADTHQRTEFAINFRAELRRQTANRL